MSHTEMTDAFLKRLNAIESQNRQLKVGGLALACCLVGVVLLGASSSASEVLDVQKLIIRDEQGKIRGKIEATDDEGIVQLLLDDAGTERIRLSVNRKGEARIWVNDDDGETRVAATSLPRSNPDNPQRANLTVLGPGKGVPLDQKSGLQLETFADGQTSQRVWDQNGRYRAFFGVEADGTARLSFPADEEKGLCGLDMGTTETGIAYQQMFGKSGKKAFVVSADPDGSVRQFFMGQDEKTRLMLGLMADETARAIFLANDGKARMNLMTKPNGESTQQLLDENGQERVSVNVLENGVANRRVSDTNGKLRLIEYSAADGDARQILFDANGDVVADNAANAEPVVVGKPVLGNDAAEKQLETRISNLNDEIVAAQLALTAARAVYNNAEPGSFAEVTAELTYIAAQRALADLQAQLERAQYELNTLRQR